MRTKVKFVGCIVIVASIILTGCDKFGMGGHVTVNTSVWDLMTISPSDKSQNVELNASIILQFAVPVEPSIVEGNFFLFSKNDISIEMDHKGDIMNHSDINEAMRNPSTMEHLKKMHNTKGKFIWNEEKTRCEFKSTSDLQPDIDYYIYMDSEMLDYMKNLMEKNGMMNDGMRKMDCPCCQSKSLNESVILVQFRTKKLSRQ